MKLYTYHSTSPRKVELFLHEKGLKVPTEFHNIGGGGARTADFLVKNPFGGVPVLELDDGTYIAESLAICRYFEVLHPEPNLIGRSAKEQAVIEMWTRRVELNVLDAAGEFWVHGSPVTAPMIKNRIPEIGARAVQRLHGYYKLLDAQLANNEFLAGDRYTLAEASSLPIIDFASKRVAVPIPDEFKNLKRWQDQMTARPSAVAHPLYNEGAPKAG